MSSVGVDGRIQGLLRDPVALSWVVIRQEHVSAVRLLLRCLYLWQRVPQASRVVASTSIGVLR